MDVSYKKEQGGMVPLALFLFLECKKLEDPFYFINRIKKVW